MIELKDFK
jgi:hypothetical protein